MRGNRDELFVSFVAASSARLVAQATLLCGDREQARDIVQTVLTRAYPRWRTIEAEDPYRYMVRAVANATIDWWRSAARRNEITTDRLPDRDDGGPGTGAEDRDVLLTALGRLTPKERATVVLRYMEDVSERDVALALGVSTGTVKSTAHSALRKLRGHLRADGDELSATSASWRRFHHETAGRRSAPSEGDA